MIKKLTSVFILSRPKTLPFKARMDNGRSSISLQETVGFSPRSFITSVCFGLCALVSVIAQAQAEDVTLIFTGQTHAMLYTCNCPYETDGGIARRLTMIKQMRTQYPNVLLVDSGGFFAGGLMDEFTQNADLDMRRSAVNLKAMELAGYDAVAIGDDEFNFGRKFFEDTVSKTKLPFVSANMKSKLVGPYSIREVAGIKFGIIGLTSVYAAQKADGIEFSDPQKAAGAAIAELKAQGVGIIIVLSYLGENDDLKLLRAVSGIDILIVGRNRSNEENAFKVNQTLVLKPSWQGRRLDRVVLTMQGAVIAKHALEQVRLSDQVPDDPQVRAFLPQCFTNNNCKKEGATGVCQNPGSSSATCLFTQSAKVAMTVVTDKACVICKAELLVKSLKNQFPGLLVSYLYYPDEKAKAFVKQLGITSLPACVFGREIEKEAAFAHLKDNFVLKGNFYLMKAEYSGMAYAINRQKVKGRLDIMLSLYTKDITTLLSTVREFNPTLHFLARQQGAGFETERGAVETEEYLRSVCVGKYYPDRFWDYVTCRAGNMHTSWWEDCAGFADYGKIKGCARSAEGLQLLGDNTALNRELNVLLGPTYLVDNRLIFGSDGVPPRNELQKIMDNQLQ